MRIRARFTVLLVTAPVVATVFACSASNDGSGVAQKTGNDTFDSFTLQTTTGSTLSVTLDQTSTGSGGSAAGTVTADATYDYEVIGSSSTETDLMLDTGAGIYVYYQWTPTDTVVGITADYVFPPDDSLPNVDISAADCAAVQTSNLQAFVGQLSPEVGNQALLAAAVGNWYATGSIAGNPTTADGGCSGAGDDAGGPLDAAGGSSDDAGGGGLNGGGGAVLAVGNAGHAPRSEPGRAVHVENPVVEKIVDWLGGWLWNQATTQTVAGCTQGCFSMVTSSTKTSVGYSRPKDCTASCTSDHTNWQLISGTNGTLSMSHGEKTYWCNCYYYSNAVWAGQATCAVVTIPVNASYIGCGQNSGNATCNNVGASCTDQKLPNISSSCVCQNNMAQSAK